MHLQLSLTTSTSFLCRGNWEKIGEMCGYGICTLIHHHAMVHK
jgi:hypothetical protein